MRILIYSLAATLIASPAFAEISSGPLAGGSYEASAEVAVELRAFPNDPALPEQFETFQPSVSIEPDFRWESESAAHQVVIVPYVRIDGQDDERTHFDIREAYWRGQWSDYALLIGAAKVFWGVTESRHLVDIVNQTDAVEDIDEEDKLGQPMVQLTALKDWGALSLFVMPGFRERTFAGRDGRLRFNLPVSDDAEFESGMGRGRPDLAARYSNYFGDWDVGVSIFHGHSREPHFALAPGGQELTPIYDVITQGAVDIQYTRGAWLWKFEGIARGGHGETFAAAVGGFEYTLYQIFGSGADLGLLAEYQYDGRDNAISPPTAADNDVFAGARLALNDAQDSEALAGVVVDAENGSTAIFFEAERRIGANWTVELESRLFVNIDDRDLLRAFADDDNVTFRVTRYF